MIAWLASTALAAELVVGTAAADLQATLDLAADGDTVIVPEGTWHGPAVVDHGIHLVGRGGKVVGDTGRTLTIRAPNVEVESLVIEGSGGSLTDTDACLYLEPTATDVHVHDNTLSRCLFGIWVDQVVRARVLHNRVAGIPGGIPPNKGNGIHVFDSTEVEIRGNTVTDARDGIYIFATENSLIAENTCSHQRYGIHYMFSYDNVVRDNTTDDNTKGMAMMSSFRLVVTGNHATHNSQHGILIRDMQYSEIAFNHVEFNGEGFFLYSSLDNDIHHNRVAHNQIGARLWAGTERNRWYGNAFTGNRQQIYFVGSADQVWTDAEHGGNHWSDHASWDYDDDGIADRPYRADAMTAALLHRYPQAVLLLNSPSLELLAAMQRRVPSLRVPTVVDEQPLVRAPEGTR